ncbi:sensor histidine kinase [Nocardioides montaniterrae]
MRERLVLAFVLLAVGVIALYGVPRAYSRADLVHDHQTQRLSIAAHDVAALVTERLARHVPVDADLLDHGLTATDRVEYHAANGDDVAVGSAADGGPSETEPVDGGGYVTVALTRSTTTAELHSALAPLLFLGLGLAVAAALAGFVMARRLARPFQELAQSAQRLGQGDFDIDVPAYSVPEAEAIGSSLRGAAAHLDRLVRREREFAANASHQLRTPITALRLSLEDLTLWPETAPAVREELERVLGELDRLNAAITELLSLARERTLATHGAIDLAALVAAAGGRWERRLREDGRSLVVRRAGTVRAQLPVGPLEQVMDVLIENARVHGTGTITLEVKDVGSHLEVSVADEGEGSLAPDIFRRGVTTRVGNNADHGVGLAVADELADAVGGHLSLDPASTTTRFLLRLPRPAEVVG